MTKDNLKPELEAIPTPLEEAVVNEERVLAHMDLAARMVPRGISDREDLQQVANEALVKADLRYDPEMGVPFGPFAAQTIKGHIKRHFRDGNWRARVPRELKDNMVHMNSVSDELTQELQRHPTNADFAAKTGLDEAQVEDVQRMKKDIYNGVAFLDAPATITGDGSQTLGDSLVDVYGMDLQDAQVVHDAVRQLDERSRKAIMMRFWEGKSQDEIGQELGVSQVHVSRILGKALEQLKDALSDEIL